MSFFSKFRCEFNTGWKLALRQSRRAFAIGILTTLLMQTSGNRLQAEEGRPNIVLIVIDNLGWADLGSYGSKYHKTPNLDRLANEGVRFTQAYTTAPIGLPTRAALLTGRYPQRMKLTASFAVDGVNRQHRMLPPPVSRSLPLEELTLAELLKSQGYATGCIGKWHLGPPGFGPREQGFDVSIASEVTGINYSSFAPYLDENGHSIPGLEQAPRGEFLTDRLAAEAEKFISDHQSQPFFLYLPHFAVHMPAQAKPELVAKYGAMPTEPSGKQSNPVYAAFIESMDEAVGRVAQALDRLGLRQRTMILLTSDNGGVCNSVGQVVAPTINAPLRDGMGHLYEGGIRVPMIASWPGTIKSGLTSNEVVSVIDVVPTSLAACRGAPPANALLDGLNLLPLMKGDDSLKRDAVYWHFPHYNSNEGARPGGAVRAGDWKLIEFFETGRRELFDLGKDPRESNNLISANHEVAKELSIRLERWRQSMGAELPGPNPDYEPNPQNDDGLVVIPASSADVSGLMLRYEPLPHKDTLGFWVRSEDWASFEFTLKKPGRYRLIPHVGCGTTGGSLVHFQIAGQTLPLTVPATGHFQNFVPQDLGTVTFDQPGRFTLTVKPQMKIGAAVMDLRKVELKPE